MKTSVKDETWVTLGDVLARRLYMKVTALPPPYHVNGGHVEQIGWQYQQSSWYHSTDLATLRLLLRLGLTVCFP